MSNTADVSYKWSKKGMQPRVEQKQNKRERVTLFGAVDPVLGNVIMQQAQRGNAKTFLKFLKKILKYYRKGKIYLILDNVIYHHAKILKPFLEKK
jgi:transposase